MVERRAGGSLEGLGSWAVRRGQRWALRRVERVVRAAAHGVQRLGEGLGPRGVVEFFHQPARVPSGCVSKQTARQRQTAGARRAQGGRSAARSLAHAQGKLSGAFFCLGFALPRGCLCLLGQALAVRRDPARQAPLSAHSPAAHGGGQDGPLAAPSPAQKGLQLLLLSVLRRHSSHAREFVPRVADSDGGSAAGHGWDRARRSRAAVTETAPTRLACVLVCAAMAAGCASGGSALAGVDGSPAALRTADDARYRARPRASPQRLPLLPPPLARSPGPGRA